jgi:hypothetical protein
MSRQQGAYLSAQLKPFAQRQGGELRRDIEALLHAHGSRSDQIGGIVAARGLNAYFLIVALPCAVHIARL